MTPQSPFRDKLPWRLMGIGAGVTTFFAFGAPILLYGWLGRLALMIVLLLGPLFPDINRPVSVFLFIGLAIVSNALFCFLFGLLIATVRK
jgi:hypothetical protein